MTLIKIAFIIRSTGWGGLEMNTLKLANLLSEKGYDIKLITQENSTIYEKGKGIFSSTFLLKKGKKYFDFKSAKAISKFLKNERIKTLMVFDNKELDVIAWTKKLYFKKLNVIYQQHMQIGINKKDLIHTFRYKSIDCWISPLNYLKNEVIERTKFSEKKVKVIPLCVDTGKFTNVKYTKQDALKKMNIEPKSMLFGIIGRISEKKGQLFLVESFMKLREKGINVELLIFGSATVNDPECQAYYKELREKVKECKLENVFHFVDYQEDVSLFYNAVDGFILGSHSETYGMVTIEAMLSNIPIIATQSGGTSEILEYGKLGLLYEYENYDELSKKIMWLLNNKSESIEMAQLAQDRAIANYSQHIEINEIDAIIKGFE